MKQVAAALVQAQKNFGPALKTNENAFFKGSRYADLATCVDAVLEALNDAGIALMQQTHECEDGVIVETVFIHESGETLSSGKLHVPAGKQDPQGYGSALTYARRYSLMAACGIAPEDDDGNAASQTKKTTSESATLTKEDIDKIAELASKVGSTIEGIQAFYKVESLTKVPRTQYGNIITALNKKRLKKNEGVQDNG